ncbi:fimbrial protein [Rahnella bonaserana]|jgi:minor fimbrial subunit|uniref:Type 1 fimbrial protein n=2 Tax=Rahnella bonaserana TaxID=2816248 RepID=A0ABS6LZ53_9GAMM|nr:fimbrial protein [Rahnella bonaserana]MBU9857271.1 type 1 fimbrial protein [Rahnella bonaserana]MCL9642412.1 type 1 fimbrial protein [Rahnella victoriana]WHZ41759.1 fimbrial protein [Rahnella bonaserana]
MMKKITVLIVTASLFTLPVLANTTTINITGKVVASPCSLSQEGALSVDLGQSLQAKDLETAGTGSTWVPFTLGLVSCPTGTTSVKATFSGTPDTSDATRLYKNSGTAGNIALELQDNKNTPLGNGSTLTGTIDTSHAYTYNLKARAFTAQGGTTPGTIASEVMVAFTYN